MKTSTKIILASILGILSLSMTIAYFLIPENSTNIIAKEPSYTFSDPDFLSSAPEKVKQSFTTELSNYFASLVTNGESLAGKNISMSIRDNSYDEYTSGGITTATFIADIEDPKMSLKISYSWGSDNIIVPFSVSCLDGETCPSTESENAVIPTKIYDSEYLLERGLSKEEYQNILSYLKNFFKTNSPETYRITLEKSTFRHNNEIYTMNFTSETNETYTLEYNQKTNSLKLS